MATEAPTCSICNNLMVELVERTEQAHEPIFVCNFERPGKHKMPCDGYLYDIASKRA